jgi:outer membrane protein TolC
MECKGLKRWAYALAGVMMISSGLQAQTMNAFSASQCVEYASKNSVQVKNALIGIKIQEETNREYTSAAYPRISGSVGTNIFPQVATQVFPNFIAAATYGVLEKEGVKNGFGNAITSPNDFGFVQAQFGTKYTASAGIELAQLLFDGQVFVGLQARTSALKLAQKNLEVTEEMIKANVLKIYYQLAAAKKQRTTLDANIARLEKLSNDTRVLYKNGFAEKLDIDKVSVTLINLSTEKEKIDRQIESGVLGLKLLMGMPVRETLVLTDTVPEEDLKNDILENSYDPADRKEMQQLQIAQQLGKFNVRRFQLSKIPTLALFSQYSTNAQRNTFNFFEFGKPWFPTSLIGFRVSYSVFEGFGRNARIQRARYELQQTQNNMELLRQSIDHDVEQARIKYKNAILSMDYQKKNMELAENIYNVSKVKYEQGLGSNLEITNAQTELRTAQNNYFGALYDAIVARIDYLKAIGKL